MSGARKWTRAEDRVILTHGEVDAARLVGRSREACVIRRRHLVGRAVAERLRQAERGT